MKKIDFIALLLIGIGLWFYFGGQKKPSGGAGTGSGTGTQKITDNSQSVLNNLDNQLDKFAEELAQDIQGVSQLDPTIKGFDGEVPEAFAPKSTSAFSSLQKLSDDLDYRLNKFGVMAHEEQQEFSKNHDVAGADHQAFVDLVNKHKAQKKQIMDRHKEILREYQKQTPQTDLR